MRVDDRLYSAYLEELQRLEKFKSAHISLYGDTPLDSEDPHAKRLIEALAFFGARARLNGAQRTAEIHQRLFRQYFPYLLHALPACGMLQLTPSLRYPEPVSFPAGSELVLKTSHEQKAFFQTGDTLDVWPLLLKSFSFDKKKGGWQWRAEYSLPHAIGKELGSFKFYIHHLNHFFLSLRVLFALQHFLVKARVSYDSADGLEAPVSFGYDGKNRPVFSHEIEQIRSLLHLPQQELFMTWNVPPSGRPWKTIAFCLELDEKWPESLILNADSLIPFIVLIANFKRGYGEPILCEGTKEYYPVLHPEPIHQFELHTLLSASKVLSSGMEPLKPRLLGDGGEGYEIDYFNNALYVEIPSSFQNPVTVAVEALWTQPWFSEMMNVDLDLYFKEAQNFGLGVRLFGGLHRHAKMEEDDPEVLIRLLSLKSQNDLNLNEILFILNAMKKLNGGFFEGIPGLILDLKTKKIRDSESFQSVIQYEFFLKEGNQRWEVAVLFFKYLNQLLNSWIAPIDVETVVHFPQFKQPLKIKQGRIYEFSALARYFLLS